MTLTEKAAAYHKHGKLDDIIDEVREECSSSRKAAYVAYDFLQALNATKQEQRNDGAQS